ncbi:ribonuclease DdI-like [Quercus lobata]|uniref:ribonuclease DdI-like n=1 Tax=Quercus lobata TaxID=97700 RepID=UPI001243E532|nr:ribonuclease DdI-like [Quercus lobata]
MWAVHSHGRAYQTESIIYNNTQLPYKENMNAETVINSKLKQGHSFMLAADTIVHGLWPQNTSGGLIDCKGAKNTAPFNFPKLEHYEDGHLVHKLNDFWPNLIINKPNYNYWKQEFEKHGSCFFPTQEQYFESTAWMVDQIPGLTPKLESEGICPGTSHLFKDLQQKIIKATGFIPKLECYQRNGTNRLFRIYFCFDKSKFLYNCSDSKLTPNNIKCGYGEVKIKLP